MGELTVGIMYVAPARQYPLYHHSPHELYLTIAGQADWRFGGNDDFRPIRPDTKTPDMHGSAPEQFAAHAIGWWGVPLGARDR